MSLHANFYKENYLNCYFVVEGWLLRLLWSLWYFLQGTLLAQVKTLSAIHPLYARLCCDFSLYTLLTNGAVVDQWTSLKRDIHWVDSAPTSMISQGVKCTPFSKLIRAAEAITRPIKIENFSKINTICFIYFCTRFGIMFLLEVFSWWCAMSSTIHNTIMCAEYACFIIWYSIQGVQLYDPATAPVFVPVDIY